jgi:Restriction endonuclease
MSLPTAVNDVIAHFFADFPTNAPPALLENVVRGLLRQTLKAEVADRFLRSYLPYIRTTLIAEFNERFRRVDSIRYRILDDEGDQIAGIGKHADRERLSFQNALNALSHGEFEGIAAIVLQLAGCNPVYRTPESHDQGLDAFGYRTFLRKRRNTWMGGAPRVIFLAQAKHYTECRIGSKDIREFVGAYTLALHQVYSTVDLRYDQLEILPLAPVALILATTEVIPNTVKRLATRAGIVVLTSDDLFDVLVIPLKEKPVRVTKAWLLKQFRPKFESIPIAK